MATLAVTGSTGQVGGRVARRLADAGVEQRLIVRDPGRAPRLPNTEIAVAAYGDAAAGAALRGIDLLFMVSAAESASRRAEHLAFVDAAADAGVRHVVYLSFLNASPDATFTLARDHAATEQHIRDRGLTWTFLRDSAYADFVPALADADGVIRGPAGDGRVSLVAQDDVGEVAARVLLDPADHEDEVLSLTGPQALSLAEVAEVLARATGRPARYEPETIEQAYASRAAYGAPEWQVEAWVSTYLAIAAGELAEVTDDIPRLTGHPATSLTQVLTRRT
jgi:uncharacterized protein YbjT (DUF2867 family)